MCFKILKNKLKIFYISKYIFLLPKIIKQLLKIDFKNYFGKNFRKNP